MREGAEVELNRPLRRYIGETEYREAPNRYNNTYNNKPPKTSFFMLNIHYATKFPIMKNCPRKDNIV